MMFKKLPAKRIGGSDNLLVGNVDKNLHILIVEDKGKKVFPAHCLDMDIVSQGKTQKEAVSELIGLIKTQMEYCLENDMLDTLFRPAPKEYWDMYHRSQAIKILNQLSLHSKDIIKNLTTIKNQISNIKNQNDKPIVPLAVAFLADYQHPSFESARLLVDF